MTEGKRNIISRELSMDFVGHTKARPVRVMHLVYDYLGIDDKYRIKSVNHKLNGGIHTMSCILDNL